MRAVSLGPPLLYPPALSLFADLDELFVSTFLFQQFLMCTSLGHCPVINHKDLIGILNCSQAMGNRNNGFTMCESRNSFLDQMFILRVNACCCLIQDN